MASDPKPEKPLRTYTLAEVKKHNKANDLWMAINGKVYDVTSFVDRHPGGPNNLIEHAGA
jgi:cytochrome b involved in lipid metabolism